MHLSNKLILASVLVCLTLLPGNLASAELEDLLWDLHIVPLDGEPAPDFSLEGLQGKKASLSDFKGRGVLLYFWATW